MLTYLPLVVCARGVCLVEAWCTIVVKTDDEGGQPEGAATVTLCVALRKGRQFFMDLNLVVIYQFGKLEGLLDYGSFSYFFF